MGHVLFFWGKFIEIMLNQIIEVLKLGIKLSDPEFNKEHKLRKEFKSDSNTFLKIQEPPYLQYAIKHTDCIHTILTLVNDTGESRLDPRRSTIIRLPEEYDLAIYFSPIDFSFIYNNNAKKQIIFNRTSTTKDEYFNNILEYNIPFSYEDMHKIYSLLNKVPGSFDIQVSYFKEYL